MTPEDLAYLRMAAARDGYNPDHAVKVFQHESSGNPTVWGGTGGKYYGLFQAGPSERKQFGVDTEHPSAANQIDAFGRFLHGRGFKPGMGLLDMYSTVLAGSPGHYNRSDGAGTVAEHVARMTGHTQLPAVDVGHGVSGGSYNFALNGLPAGLFDTASQDTTAAELEKADKAAQAEREAAASKRSLLSSLETLTKPKQPELDPAVFEANQRAFNEFANQQHQQAIGLLSRPNGLLGA